MKDELNGLDKAVSAVLGQRTIERNLLLVSIAKSKLSRNRDDKNEKVTKPEELVRLYDLLLQVSIVNCSCFGRSRSNYVILVGNLIVQVDQIIWQVSCSVLFYLQNVGDLSDLVTSGRDRKAEEVSFAEECALKSLAFRAERYSVFL